MKKNRLCSFLLCAALFTGLLTSAASATGSGSAILDSMHLEAGAAVLVDTDYGEVLYDQNAHGKMYPASITKVMTCLLTLEAVDRGELTLEQVVTAGADLHTGIGSGGSTADIKEGEQMRIIDLLYSALIPSANEACNVLAVAVAGDIPAFVEQMNTRAAELGMTGTHFANTHGYHDDNHYTTAYDISLMCCEAMEHETFRTIVSSRNYTLPATNMHEERLKRSTNALISNFNVAGYLYQYATGIKTGHTPEAGYCLASAAEKNGRSLIAVVMGCEREPGSTGSAGRRDFSETIRLFNWGFDNFSRRTILDSTKLDIAEVEVTLSDQANYVAVRPEGELAATLPVDLDEDDFTYTWTLDAERVEAPIQEGQTLGSITVSLNGTEYGTLPLVANASVERSELLYRLDRIQKFFNQLWVKLLLLAVVILVVVILLRRIFSRGRRSYRRGGYAYSGRSRRGRRR